jgi:hypothetical protein
MERKTKILVFRNFVLVLLCVVCFATGFFINKKQSEKPNIIDFSLQSRYDQYAPDFIQAVGLFELYHKENKTLKNVRTYFDTLKYFRNQLFYYNIQDTSYLILFKPNDAYFYANPVLYGFTKNKFFIYHSQEVILKNYPSEKYVRRVGG